MFLYPTPYGFRQSYTFLPVQLTPNSHPKTTTTTKKPKNWTLFFHETDGPKKTFFWLPQHMPTATHIHYFLNGWGGNHRTAATQGSSVHLLGQLVPNPSLHTLRTREKRSSSTHFYLRYLACSWEDD